MDLDRFRLQLVEICDPLSYWKALLGASSPHHSPGILV